MGNDVLVGINYLTFGLAGATYGRFLKWRVEKHIDRQQQDLCLITDNEAGWNATKAIRESRVYPWAKHFLPISS